MKGGFKKKVWMGGDMHGLEKEKVDGWIDRLEGWVHGRSGGYQGLGHRAGEQGIAGVHCVD